MLQIAQWYSSGVLSLYLLVFYHTTVSPFKPLLPSIAIPSSVMVVDLGKLLKSEPDGMFH